MKGWRLLALIVLIFPLLAHAGGTISGKVQLRGNIRITKTHPVLNDVEVCGTNQSSEELLLSKQDEIRNVVVFIDGSVPGGRSLDLKVKPELDQKGCRFLPHINLVPVGVPLTISNSDGLVHSLRNVSHANPPTNVLQNKTGRVSFTFARPEMVKLTCDFHPWMAAWAVVMEHPYYTVTNESGDFTLTDVPAGEYLLTAWQEFLGPRHKRIAVHEGENTKVDFLFLPK